MQSLSCSMWHQLPDQGLNPRPPALGAWSLSHWTTREVPHNSLLLPKAFHCMSHLCGTSREICCLVTPRDAEKTSGNWIHFITSLHLVGGHLQAKEKGLRRNYPCPLLDLGLPARKACKIIRLCCWSSPVCGPVLQQPKQNEDPQCWAHLSYDVCLNLPGDPESGGLYFSH